MASQLRQQIEQISREKNINPEVIIAAIEDAILTASKKYYKGAEDLRSRFNDETGQIEVFAVRQIVDSVEIPETQIGLDEAKTIIPEAEVGQEIEFPKPTDVLGRIAAQTAKQVIFQKVREAERDNVFAEYSGRVGEVVNGIIKRQEMGDFVVDLGRAEAVLPRKEQSRAETYQTGDRVRVAIVKVLKSAKGPQVVVSRTDPALLVKLFEMEVPEIYDGTVQIQGCVREAGERAKVAVISRERDVDPVGACVGMKGTRVQSIIRELRGREDRHRGVERRSRRLRGERPLPGQGEPGLDPRRGAEDHGGGGRGQAAEPRHRQEGPERPPGRQARGLAHRHQERGREAPGGRGRDGAHGAHRGRAARASSPTASPTRSSRSSSTPGCRASPTSWR